MNKPPSVQQLKGHLDSHGHAICLICLHTGCRVAKLHLVPRQCLLWKWHRRIALNRTFSLCMFIADRQWADMSQTGRCMAVETLMPYCYNHVGVW